MEIQQKPDYLIFAEGSKSGELSDFPDIERGWGVTLEQTQAKPPLEWMNGAFNRIDKNTLYLLQQGVPEWSENVLYPIGAIIKVGGTLYEAKTQNTNLNPANSPNDWQLVVRFQDATTKQKGIVQLSSATDSESEAQAATSLAVKQVNDLISTQNSGRLLNVIKITETSTYTPSKGTNFIIVEAVGGGGAGGGTYSNDVNSIALGAGGGGGAYCKSKLFVSEIDNSVSVIIGAGGSGVVGNDGGAGGDTKFGSFFTAGGGKGGVMAGPSQDQFLTASSGGGTATNGNLINSSGSLSGYGIYLNSRNRTSGYGGTSMLSADAGTGTFQKKNGFDASGFGCGGGGACIYTDTGSYYGGSGYQGVVIVWEYA